MATETLNLRKKIFSSEVITRMKLKFCRNYHNISLYKTYVFNCCCLCAFVAMATYNFHRLIMGKVKGGLYFYPTADILTEVFQKCSLSRPLPNIRIMSKPLNLIGCNDNRKDKFAKEYLKTHLLRNIHSVCLYKRYAFIAVAHKLSLLFQLKISVEL